ncbi:hypothetical protein [Gilliamella sp. wkB112]|uniref:hypothetical protein n=1 Tax=Gilliamella sp. wkB112 TaxID=3120257 RepID=UPI00080DA3E1|nr:hypothetical protein [Gilliamella apicola]OCG00864.1 hypothetical protein A9G12_03630 [Gilliamella apicola]
MKIDIFIANDKVESSFDLGGLEFFGNCNRYSKENYKSNDLQMIFISVSDFVFNIRQKKQYIFSSNIKFFFNEKKEHFFVNDLLIEKIPFESLILELFNLITKSIYILKNVSISKSDAVMMDLINEQKKLKQII